MTDLPADDPQMAPYWEGCMLHELRVQRCADCAHAQFYPRPICLNCGSTRLPWIVASGRGVVYSCTTVWRALREEWPPPYRVALVDLMEGPRFLTALTDESQIGSAVSVGWMSRVGLPPLPVFSARDSRSRPVTVQ